MAIDVASATNPSTVTETTDRAPVSGMEQSSVPGASEPQTVFKKSPLVYLNANRGPGKLQPNVPFVPEPKQRAKSLIQVAACGEGVTAPVAENALTGFDGLWVEVTTGEGIAVNGTRAVWSQRRVAEFTVLDDQRCSSTIAGELRSGRRDGSLLKWEGGSMWTFVAKITISDEEIQKLARKGDLDSLLRMLDLNPRAWTVADSDGHTLLHWAALGGHQELIKESLTNGLPVDVTANNGQTPLMWAANGGQIQAIRALLDAGADLYQKDSLGASASVIAIQQRQHEALLLLFKRGDVQKLLREVDVNGCTCVHWAAYKGDGPCIRLLDYFGADLNRFDNQGMAPMHRACKAGYWATVEELWKRGCHLASHTKDGRTVLDMATQANDTSMIYHLKRMEKEQQKNAAKAATVSHKKTDDLEMGVASQKDFSGQPTTGRDSNHMEKAFPAFWLVCVSITTFAYTMNLRPLTREHAPVCSTLFELCVPLCLAVFFRTCLMDPGKIPARPKGRSGVEDLMAELDKDAKPFLGFSRLCLTDFVRKDLRTKYCKETQACIEEFDHYCVWLNCAIGKRNHRWFITLCLLEGFTQLMFVLTLFFTMWVLVPYQNFFGWVFAMMVTYPLLCGLGPLHCATILWVTALSGQQLQLVWRNLTTNEYMNMHRYNHFKIFKDASCQEHVGYHNPFDKGHPYFNCLDFWWYQKRSCRFVPCRCPVCAPSQAAKREKQKRLEAELAAKADPAL